jgi:fatty-acyl-CoA synthase
LVPQPRLIRYDVESDTHVRDPGGLCIECAPDEVGELVGEIPQKADTLQGRFEGYTSKAETERKILRDVRGKGDTWFRTGDLLRCDKQGYFYFVDRIGDTFRWKGENVSTQEVAEAVGAYPGIQLVNVYGVELGADGRAGMAAIVLDDPSRFDGKAFYELASGALPAYAAPVFVRLQPEPEITGTFKLRKVDLQREGYDSDAIEDPLYVRDDSRREYVELTPERLQAVKSGELRV